MGGDGNNPKEIITNNTLASSTRNANMTDVGFESIKKNKDSLQIQSNWKCVSFFCKKNNKDQREPNRNGSVANSPFESKKKSKTILNMSTSSAKL